VYELTLWNRQCKLLRVTVSEDSGNNAEMLAVYDRLPAVRASNYELGNIAAPAALASTDYADGRVLATGNDYSNAGLSAVGIQ
jgi:hypothetical protein